MTIFQIFTHQHYNMYPTQKNITPTIQLQVLDNEFSMLRYVSYYLLAITEVIMYYSNLC